MCEWLLSSPSSSPSCSHHRARWPSRQGGTGQSEMSDDGRYVVCSSIIESPSHLFLENSRTEFQGPGKLGTGRRLVPLALLSPPAPGRGSVVESQRRGSIFSKKISARSAQRNETQFPRLSPERQISLFLDSGSGSISPGSVVWCVWMVRRQEKKKETRLYCCCIGSVAYCYIVSGMKIDVASYLEPPRPPIICEFVPWCDIPEDAEAGISLSG